MHPLRNGLVNCPHLSEKAVCNDDYNIANYVSTFLQLKYKQVETIQNFEGNLIVFVENVIYSESHVYFKVYVYRPTFDCSIRVIIMLLLCLTFICVYKLYKRKYLDIYLVSLPRGEKCMRQSSH